MRKVEKKTRDHKGCSKAMEEVRKKENYNYFTRVFH